MYVIFTSSKFNPNFLHCLKTISEFKRQYADPITFSRQPGIDQDAQELGEERAAELNELSSGFILRRTQDVNDKYLPNKHEMIIFCSSTKLQVKILSCLFNIPLRLIKDKQFLLYTSEVKRNNLNLLGMVLFFFSPLSSLSPHFFLSPPSFFSQVKSLVIWQT